MRLCFRTLLLGVPLCLGFYSTAAWATSPCGQRAVAFQFVSEDRRELIAGVEDVSGTCGEILGIDFNTGKVLWRHPGMTTSAHAALSRDGSRLAVSYAGQPAGGNTPFVVLDARTGQLITTLQQDRANGLTLTGGDASSVALSPDGKEVYAVLRNGWLAAWDATTGKSLFTQDPPEASGPGNAATLAIAPDGGSIAWGRPRGVFLLALPPRGSGGKDVVATVRGHIAGRDLHDLHFSPDGKRLAVAQGSVPGNTLLWSVKPWHAQAPITGCGDEIAWSPDSHALACQTENAVQLVDVAAPAHVLDRKPRTALETPLTPLSSNAGILLFQEQSPRADGPAPLVFSAFGTPATKTFTLPAAP